MLISGCSIVLEGKIKNSSSTRQRFRFSKSAIECGSLCVPCALFSFEIIRLPFGLEIAKNGCVCEIQMCAEFNTKSFGWWNRHHLCWSTLQVHGFMCSMWKKKKSIWDFALNSWLFANRDNVSALSRLPKLESNHNNEICPF